MFRSGLWTFAVAAAAARCALSGPLGDDGSGFRFRGTLSMGGARDVLWLVLSRSGTAMGEGKAD